jgi:hypothetical protein
MKTPFSLIGAESSGISALEKIAALAIHPTTPENEWRAAAIAFFRIHRRNGTAPSTEGQTLPESFFNQRSRAPWMKPSPFLETIIPNDRYPGRTVRQIIGADPDYATELIAEWAARNTPKAKAKGASK